MSMFRFGFCLVVCLPFLAAARPVGRGTNPEAEQRSLTRIFSRIKDRLNETQDKPKLLCNGSTLKVSADFDPAKCAAAMLKYCEAVSELEYRCRDTLARGLDPIESIPVTSKLNDDFNLLFNHEGFGCTLIFGATTALVEQSNANPVNCDSSQKKAGILRRWINRQTEITLRQSIDRCFKVMNGKSSVDRIEGCLEKLKPSNLLPVDVTPDGGDVNR